jgi:deoxyribodipyrimidine photo-lyase
VLLTEEDLSPGFLVDLLDGPPHGHAALISAANRSPLPVSPAVLRFTQEAVTDAQARWASRLGPAGPVAATPAEIADWSARERLEQIVTAFTPVGPAATALDDLDRRLSEIGVRLVRVMRTYDQRAWPHASHGFFRFKKEIPALVAHI